MAAHCGNDPVLFLMFLSWLRISKSMCLVAVTRSVVMIILGVVESGIVKCT